MAAGLTVCAVGSVNAGEDTDMPETKQVLMDPQAQSLNALPGDEQVYGQSPVSRCRWTRRMREKDIRFMPQYGMFEIVRASEVQEMTACWSEKQQRLYLLMADRTSASLSGTAQWHSSTRPSQSRST